MLLNHQLLRFYSRNFLPPSHLTSQKKPLNSSVKLLSELCETPCLIVFVLIYSTKKIVKGKLSTNKYKTGRAY